MVILEEQFKRLRDGDRFYYMADPAIGYAEKTNIKYTRLADVIRRNTDIERLQDEVFKVEQTPTSTQDVTLQVNEVTLFPNPATDYIQLELVKELKVDLNVRLYDITGRTWMTREIKAGERTLLVQLPDGLRPGYYWVSMIGGKNSWLGRFVKQ